MTTVKFFVIGLCSMIVFLSWSCMYLSNELDAPKLVSAFYGFISIAFFVYAIAYALIE